MMWPFETVTEAPKKRSFMRYIPLQSRRRDKVVELAARYEHDHGDGASRYLAYEFDPGRWTIAEYRITPTGLRFESFPWEQPS